MSLKNLNNKLNNAKKNYRLAVRWYREVLLYRSSTQGDEWKSEGLWMMEDSKNAYDDVVSDIRYYRAQINKYKEQIEKEEEYGRE